MIAGARRTWAAQTRFFLQVIDDATGRGVPLVELTTVSHLRLYTDSDGIAAIDDPALAGRRVFFNVASPGYEFSADGYGMRGRAVDVTPGKHETFKIHRLNIAQRLYRITGEGIYRDSVLAARPVPIKQPLLNAQVVGQDSAFAVPYRGKIYWFWGDTLRQSYPLGHFGTAGATSELPDKGGLDPDRGIDLTYFVDADGFSRPMTPRSGAELRWVDGVMVLPDENGHQRMLAMVARMKSLGECRGRDLALLDDSKAEFETLQTLPDRTTLYPKGHPVKTKAGDREYFYFPHPCPDIRVEADFKAVQDFSRYEAFTPLRPGTADLERDDTGKLTWAWKRDALPLDFEQQQILIQSGKLHEDEAWFRPRDVETRKPVHLKLSDVAYNAFRKRWIMIATEVGGKSSFLGEIWYSEAPQPEGPWRWARKIITHDRYSFYNPVMHPFFEKEGGRIIYFEGTYTGMFSREGDLTPRYDYNQIMYKLDLSDPRLVLPE
jgi:hypothetical protein